MSETEGNSGTKLATFTVTLSESSPQKVTVQYTTANGTAGAPTDYISTNGTLTFNPGVTTRTIDITINGDTTVEPNETFFVNLSNPDNATIADRQGQVTIRNDDIAPRITVTKVVINNDGGGAVVGDFPLFVDGSPVTSGVEITVNPGLHNVSETNLPGYAGTISGNCTPNGDIVLNVGDVASCTITNNDIAARITVTKVVINNDGGGAVVGDLPLFVDGSPVTSGVEIAVNAGVHNVSETNLPGYAGSISGNCTPNGDIVLNVGDVASCTITNNDIAARITG